MLIPCLASSVLSCLGVALGAALLKFRNNALTIVFKAIVLFSILARCLIVLELLVKGSRIFGMCYIDTSFRVMLNLMNMASIGMLAALYWIIKQAKKL